MAGEPVKKQDFDNFKKITNDKAKFCISLGSTESTLSAIYSIFSR